MLFILTYFHMYWKNIVSQAIYTDIVENKIKKAQTKKAKCKLAQRIKRAAHLPIKLGPQTHVAVL
jgi:hypothetical protein